MHRLTRLPNGLIVATAAMPHMASVCLGVWVGVGSRFETTAQGGAAHFIEHLLFKGTRHRTARQISEEVEGHGGYLNAYTSEDHTCFYAKARADRFPALLDVLMDMFLASRFAPADIAKEREVIKEERASYRDQPQHLVQELLNETLWPGHPMGRAIEGTPRSLDGLNRARLREFFQTNYVAANTFIVAAGNVTHAEMVKAIAPYAKGFSTGPRPQCEPVGKQNNASGPRVRLHTKATEQTQLALGIRTGSRHDERRFALRVLNALLGECMSSRLFQSLREDRGIAYDVHSSVSFFADCGDLSIYAGVDEDKLEKGLRLIAAELRGLVAKAPPLSEVRRARDYVIGQFDLALESTEPHMTWLGELVVGHGRLKPPALTRDQLAAVTPAQIRAAARDFFRPERLSLALVSPLKSAAHLVGVLKLG
ncbi:MAG: Peptidase M16 domain protein [Limisphaerales bacterium]|nr:MAG: Peptidase M16 domain protein [Limisphaerales bacterium]KAG0506932.1 MAG: Peptidase M16 domain protein [Limisphaerales bacterium]TXT47159.1 MAG: Peptidase M16 domain protein [Limisphaerales bacterium]